MIGSLYIITNSVNHKVYIGKTYTSIEKRWKRHLTDCDRKNENGEYKYKYPIYNAIRKHGKEKFKIRLIGKFEEGELEEAEIEYIKRYDSFKNGYNATLGGDGKRSVDVDESEVVKLYKEGKSIKTIAKRMDVSNRSIRNILEGNNVEVKKEYRIVMVQMTKEGEELQRFENKKLMHKQLVENYKRDIKASTAYYYTKKAAEKGTIAFGYRWRAEKGEEVEGFSIGERRAHSIKVMDNDRNLLEEFSSPLKLDKWLIERGVINANTSSRIYKMIYEEERMYGYIIRVERQ